jgi:hypothetical protein
MVSVLIVRQRVRLFSTTGVFFVTGPSEASTNNLGTIYHNPLSTPMYRAASKLRSNARLHNSDFTSTIARLITGNAFRPPRAPSRLLPPSRHSKTTAKGSALPSPAYVFLLGLAFSLRASPLISSNPSLLPLVSALAGTGYGAIFSLTPIIISVVWGVQNFGTDWGVVAAVPAAGATVWGAVCSLVPEKGTREGKTLC